MHKLLMWSILRGEMRKNRSLTDIQMQTIQYVLTGCKP
jgi:hypothetical protein